MTVYFWRIPDLYPNRYVGVYEQGPDWLALSSGDYVHVDSPLHFLFDEASLDSLVQLGCLWNNIGVPIVEGKLAQFIKDLGGEDVQLLPCAIDAKDRSGENFFVLNILPTVLCINHKESIIHRFDEGEISGFKKLKLKTDACMMGHMFAREREYRSFIVVSEEAMLRISTLNLDGVQFFTDRSMLPYD